MSERKRIFILEDDYRRIDLFKEKLQFDYDLTITVNSDDAIQTLKLHKFDLLCLDHDLGSRQMVNSLEYDTGYRVACEIPNTINKDTPAIIHSYNPSGAGKMWSTLTCEKKMCSPFHETYFASDRTYWDDITDYLK